MSPQPTPPDHDTEIWSSAGGFYGWDCSCGTGGKGLSYYSAAMVDSHRHLSAVADPWLARLTQERDQARVNHATTQLNLELAQQSLAEARDRIDDLRAVLAIHDQRRADALALHVSAENYTGCRACGRDWPCDTRRALGADDD